MRLDFMELSLDRKGLPSILNQFEHGLVIEWVHEINVIEEGKGFECLCHRIKVILSFDLDLNYSKVLAFEGENTSGWMYLPLNGIYASV